MKSILARSLVLPFFLATFALGGPLPPGTSTARDDGSSAAQLDRRGLFSGLGSGGFDSTNFDTPAQGLNTQMDSAAPSGQPPKTLKGKVQTTLETVKKGGMDGLRGGFNNAKGMFGSSKDASGSAQRTITVVTDSLLTADLGHSTTSGTPIRAAHSWMVFSGTKTDGPLKIELVAPRLATANRGIAIRVINYRLLNAKDQSKLSWPVPDSYVRTEHVLAQSTTLTNDQIFAARQRGSGSNVRGLPSSVVERVWLSNVQVSEQVNKASVDGKGNVLPGRFGNSHTLIQRLLEDIARQMDQPAADLAVVGTMVRPGLEWAAAKLKANRPEPDEATQWQHIDHVFYEIENREPKKGQKPLTDRYLFDIQRDGFAPYAAWVPNKVQEINSLDLSDDARLTSDILPLAQRGAVGIKGAASAFRDA